MRPSAGNGTFFTKQISRVFFGLIIFSVFLHIFLTLLSDPQNKSMIKRGDFPAFYAAGESVRAGQPELLYQTEWQKYLQNKSWPSLHGGYLYFSYPVWVATFFVPFSLLPPLIAKCIFVVMLSLCLLAAAIVSSKFSPVWKVDLWATAAFLVSFFPLTASILGGQNTAFSMLCYGLFLYGIKRGDLRGQQIAGIALGLWFFKVQYAGFFLIFALLGGFYRVVLYALVMIVMEYGLGSLIAGWDWPGVWFQAAKEHAFIDLDYNAYQMISFHGVSRAIARLFEAGPGAVHILETIAVFFAAFLFFWTSRKFVKAKALTDGSRNEQLFSLFAFAGPVVLLISPHALFYDTGIVLISGAYFMDTQSKIDRSFWLMFWILGSVGMIFKQMFPVQPAFMLCLLVLARLAFKLPVPSSRPSLS